MNVTSDWYFQVGSYIKLQLQVVANIMLAAKLKLAAKVVLMLIVASIACNGSHLMSLIRINGATVVMNVRATASLRVALHVPKWQHDVIGSFTNCVTRLENCTETSNQEDNANQLSGRPSGRRSGDSTAAQTLNV